MSWVRVSLKETRERKGSMVSFRTAPAPKEANFFAAENSSFKRKFGDLLKDSTHVELQMERPLPLEWQQCLDLQSGQIHFYNTRTRKRTCKDPREEGEELDHSPKKTMRLELELNLPYDSLSDNESNMHKESGSRRSPDSRSDDSQVTAPVKEEKQDDLHIRAKASADPRPTRLLLPDLEKEAQEMVAAACMRCHMLVMLCKASPTCPNCKFLHPLDQKDHGPLFKPGPGLGLLCCKD
ncbi:hypothetical protein EJ110_NYTH01850 [Nymphaea thermarum]|nr:hypothetical protein EJ110_NYTH01850 [Nymphaea thermarum]